MEIRNRSFLVLESSPLTMRAIHRALEPYRTVLPATSVAEAEAILAGRPRLSGVVVEASANDDCGFAFLARLRRSDRLVPVLVTTTRLTSQQVGQAYDLRADLLPKEELISRIRRFAAECVSLETTGDARVARALREYADANALGALDLEVIDGAMRGRRAEWFTRQRGVPVSTYKSRVHALLKKTSSPDLDSVIRKIFWDALGEEDEAPLSRSA
jgi:DNA-binding NarL/FixJ family response regulator